MTTNFDSQVFDSYVPVYDVIPANWEESRPVIVEQFKRVSNAVNLREIGWFLDEEVLSGKAFIPSANQLADGGTSQQFRQVFRKVIDFGPLPAAGSKSVPHGISVTANFTLVQAYAAATDPVALVSFPIPYAEPVILANAVSLTIDSTNVNITVGINRSNFTRCFVVLEYLQET